MWWKQCEICLCLCHEMKEWPQWSTSLVMWPRLSTLVVMTIHGSFGVPCDMRYRSLVDDIHEHETQLSHSRVSLWMLGVFHRSNQMVGIIRQCFCNSWVKTDHTKLILNNQSFLIIIHKWCDLWYQWHRTWCNWAHIHEESYDPYCLNFKHICQQHEK
jgi:hypothetical protein